MAKRKRMPVSAAPPPRPIDMVNPAQRDKGVWAEAQGFDMRDKPVINLAEDMIGRLGTEGLLTPQQVDAARQFQALWAGYRYDLGTHGYVSCLVERTGGYDGSDGNPAAVRAYNTLCSRIGRPYAAVLKLECDKPRHGHPGNIDVLRCALDCVTG